MCHRGWSIDNISPLDLMAVLFQGDFIRASGSLFEISAGSLFEWQCCRKACHGYRGGFLSGNEQGFAEVPAQRKRFSLPKGSL